MIELSFGNFYKNSVFLAEGGNIFSSRRINKAEVIPTLKKAEELTGLSLMDNVLGTTGKTETSGDLDVVVDSNKTNKDEFIKHLVSKGVDPTHLKKTGIEVAYKSPIYGVDGKETGDFVQTDFMFHDDPAYLKFYYANNEDAPHRGSHRNITMASIAKAKGYSLSMKGLANRETKEIITRDPKVLANKILGDDATEKDLYNIPSIIRYLRKHYSEEEIQAMVGEAETTIGMEVL
tara:strand:- start:643 stop:1344 length:702 start_codon:yes stop_codon:yes gene_type:complete